MDKTVKTEDTKCDSNALFLTVCIVLALMVFGALSNILGPTLVHLGYIFNVNIAKMSLVYTCISIGYIIGSVITGLVFDRFNHELQLFLISFTMGLVFIAAPWVPNIYWFYFMITILSVTTGYFDSCAQPYPVRLWSGHRFKGPIIQALYSATTIGSFIGPFVVRPFLVELESVNGTRIETNVSLLSSNIIHELTTIVNVTAEQTEIIGIEMVRYPYVIMGAIMSLTSFSFIFAYFIKSKSKINQINTKGNKNNGEEPGSIYEKLIFKVVFLSILALFAFVLLQCMAVPSGLLSAFVIKGLKWNVEKGPLVTSIFSGSQVIGRLLAIPASALIQPAMLISLNVTITTAAFILLSFVSSTTPYLMWTSAVLAGLGTSTTFPTLFLWTANFFPMSGSVGAVFFIAGSFGVMTGTALAGYMFEHYSHMWVAYICLLAAAADVVLLVLALIFIQCYARQHRTLLLSNNDKSKLPLKGYQSEHIKNDVL